MSNKQPEPEPLVGWLAVFFSVLTLMVGLVAATGVVVAGLGIGKFCFMTFLVLFYASLLLRIARDT